MLIHEYDEINGNSPRTPSAPWAFASFPSRLLAELPINSGVIRLEGENDMKRTRTIWFGAILCLIAAGVVRTDSAWTGELDSSTQRVSADLSDIRHRAESMPTDKRQDIDKRIGLTVERINSDASAKGQTKIAERLASKFDVTSDVLLGMKGEYGLSWGELVVAHTLLANSSVKVDLPDLASLRSEGLSWGAIAFGLRFHMEDLEEAIKAGGRVAIGISKAKGVAGK